MQRLDSLPVCELDPLVAQGVRDLSAQSGMSICPWAGQVDVSAFRLQSYQHSGVRHPKAGAL